MKATSRSGLGLVVLWACSLAAGAGAGNLVYNGDFEPASDESPPPGWVMWGARKYKDPANYTRDTAGPHSGKACFRIHHPANTAGYVVSDPRRAIRTRKGMCYRVSLWARTDSPGNSLFHFEAYSSIQPYRDAPSPGRWPINVGREWRKFTCEIHEGRDFHADTARWVLLAFRVTRDDKLAKTLWIDDVSVTESPSTAAAGLIDEGELKVEPLRHRVKPGATLALHADARKRLGRATREACGVSFHRVAGYGRHPYDRAGKYVLEPALQHAVREMRLPMTRFYAVGDEPFGLEGSLDRVAEICKRMAIPPEMTVLELETQSATTKLAPEVWARAAKYAADKGYGFRFWEIANEPYTRKAEAFGSPEAYVAHFKAVAAALRKAQPGAQIGLPIHPEGLAWGSYVLKQAAGGYDFVVGHYYCGADAYKRPLEEVVLTENYRTLQRVLRTNALIAAYNPGRSVYQLDTEWGLAGPGPGGQEVESARRNANIVGTLHRAVRMIYYVREGMLRGASGWEMFCRLKQPGFGILSRDAPDSGLMLYWLYYHFNRHVGHWALDAEGTCPYYTPARAKPPAADEGPAGPLAPALATLSEDGRTVYVVIANGSSSAAVPCRIDLANFTPAGAAGVVLSQGDLDADPLVRRKEDAVRDLPVKLSAQAVTLTVPPRAVVFVSVAGET